MSTMSAATGFLASRHALTWRLLPTSTAVLLLACAASSLNEVQEHKLDALMARTRGRPIPSGKISATASALLSLALGAVALAVLAVMGGRAALALGALAVLWYNGVYTYAKRVTSLAPVIGSLIGAIPPALGWVCAGVTLDGPILSLSFFLLMWQVPHFWLLALLVNSEYQHARFPTFVSLLGAHSVTRVTFAWTAATAASALLLPIFGLARSPLLGLGLAALGAWLVLVAWRALRTPGRQGIRRAFRAINYYALLVMSSVMLDAVLAR
jgi:protoheme IX farnesyltransferase